MGAETAVTIVLGAAVEIRKISAIEAKQAIRWVDQSVRERELPFHEELDGSLLEHLP